MDISVCDMCLCLLCVYVNMRVSECILSASKHCPFPGIVWVYSSSLLMRAVEPSVRGRVFAYENAIQTVSKCT